jgi:hypothetical protein
MAENVKYPQDEEKNEYRYLDFAWLDEIAMGLTAGAKKHPGETWREIPAREHVARAIRHLSMHQTGDSSEPHLINASMRCMMAFAMATGRATMAERTDRDAPQVTVTAEEMAMLTGGVEESEAKHKLENVERVCAVCGKTYMGYSGRSKYCSDDCRAAAKEACNNRQYEERKKPKPEREVSRKKAAALAREAEKARRKESMAHLGELTREAHEAGLSYGQYMAKKRMAEGVTEHG